MSKFCNCVFFVCLSKHLKWKLFDSRRRERKKHTNWLLEWCSTEEEEVRTLLTLCGFSFFSSNHPLDWCFNWNPYAKQDELWGIYISIRNLCRETRERWIEKEFTFIGLCGRSSIVRLKRYKRKRKKRRKLRGLILIICWVIAAANTSTTQVERLCYCCCFLWWNTKEREKEWLHVTCWWEMSARCVTGLEKNNFLRLKNVLNFKAATQEHKLRFQSSRKQLKGKAVI